MKEIPNILLFVEAFVCLYNVRLVAVSICVAVIVQEYVKSLCVCVCIFVKFKHLRLLLFAMNKTKLQSYEE